MSLALAPTPPPRPDQPCDRDRGCTHGCSYGTEYGATEYLTGKPIPFVREADDSDGNAVVSVCRCEHHGIE